MQRLERELAVARSAIDAATGEVLDRYARFERIAEAPGDITTDADLAAERIVVERLQAEFPGDCILSEHLPPPGPADRCWVLDPIDGTRGFARKDGEFSLLLALLERGHPVLGLVQEPIAERVTWAVAGEGCFTRRGGDAVRCRVSDRRPPPRTVAMSRSQGEEGRRRLLAALGAESAVQTWSAGIKLALVARGEVDLWPGDYRGLHDWDVCAGHLLVLEAGGRVTTLDGAEVVYDGSGHSLRQRGLLASNGHLHEAALAALAAADLPHR